MTAIRVRRRARMRSKKCNDHLPFANPYSFSRTPLTMNLYHLAALLPFECDGQPSSKGYQIGSLGFLFFFFIIINVENRIATNGALEATARPTLVRKVATRPRSPRE